MKPKGGGKHRPRKATATGPNPVALTRSFRRHQAAIQRCFQANAETLAGAPEVAIHFQINSDGAVQKARTIPAGIGPTVLGDCLLAIAKKTNFGTQPAAVAFQIPLKAHSSK